MKYSLSTLFFICATAIMCMGQPAKKPSIMVVPSDNWCELKGYTTSFNDQGTTKKLPDYRKALQGDYDLGAVISKLGELMADRGFPLVDLQSVLKKLETESAKISMTNSDDTGAALAESPVDVLNRTAKADIIMQISWKLEGSGPRKQVSFNLQGLDAYTYKQVAASSGTGAASASAPVVVLLEEAVIANIDQFNNQLMTHFEDLFANGREGALVIKVWDDSPVNLETEFELKGKSAELKRIVNSFWMPRNTKEGRFSQDEASRNVQKFSQVRIPLFGDDGWGGQIAYDFTTWGETLSDFLKSEFGITSKVVPKGLGEVNLILGGK